MITLNNLCMHTLPFEKISKTDVLLAGGKGASLGEMTQANIPVPPGFVVLSTAFDEFIKTHSLASCITRTLQTINYNNNSDIEEASQKIQQLILHHSLSSQLADEIYKQFSKLNSEFVAVRSSATSEDSLGAAWAGQLDSFLNTTKEQLVQNIQRCWASLFTPRALFYRFEKKLLEQPISVAVVVQKMIQSEVSGIAFSVHPVTQNSDELIIEAGFGLGEAIVSGQITPDNYTVDKTTLNILDSYISSQTRGIFKNALGQNLWIEIPAQKQERQKLDDRTIQSLAAEVIRIEKHYNFPVDIEWAIKNNQLFIVQSRPITTLL
jgi:pyruvate,water dikinase